MNDSRIFRPALDTRTSPSGWTTWREADPAEAPAISVILPAGDTDDDLESRLPGALRQTVNPHEVFVVDTSSDGRHLSTVARFEQEERRTVIRYIRSPFLGRRALQRLMGRLASGNVKAFAWAGSALSTTWVERIADGVSRLRVVRAAMTSPRLAE